MFTRAFEAFQRLTLGQKIVTGAIAVALVILAPSLLSRNAQAEGSTFETFKSGIEATVEIGTQLIPVSCEPFQLDFPDAACWQVPLEVPNQGYSRDINPLTYTFQSVYHFAAMAFGLQKAKDWKHRPVDENGITTSTVWYRDPSTGTHCMISDLTDTETPDERGYMLSFHILACD